MYTILNNKISLYCYYIALIIQRAPLLFDDYIGIFSYLTYPVLFRSIILGKNDRKYAHVHIKSKITDNKL